MAHAHTHLVLHRDLKPSNVLVDGEGRVKLLDFGVGSWLDQEGVRAAPAGALRFTPDYAAPEQVQGGAITTATDVYALGVLAHVLLTGRHPFNAPPDAPCGPDDRRRSRVGRRRRDAAGPGGALRRR